MKLSHNKKILIIILMALFFIMIFNIKVYAEDTTFSISAESIDVVLNGTKYISYTGGDTSQSVVWSSADSSIATVDNGSIKALKIGKTTITATRGTETASCEINVIYADVKIGANGGDSVTTVNLVLKEYASEQLKSKVVDYNYNVVTEAKVEWDSTAPNVVTVDKDTGLITAQGIGTATITAKSAGVSDTVEVNVYNAPQFTDFSKAKYQSELTYEWETLKISDIEPNENNQYYYIITPNETKPNLILKNSGGIDTEKMNDNIEYFSVNQDEKYIYSRDIEKYTELNQELHLWIIQEVRLECNYVNDNGNNVYYSTKYVVENQKLERATLPALNLILQTFSIGYWESTTTNENDNYTYINFNFPSKQENRKFTLKIGKVTDTNLLLKIKNNDYNGITELLDYAKNHEAIYSQKLTTTSTAYFRSDETLFDGNSLLEDDAYYYIYVQFDDENKKYYPIEGVTLGQAWKSSVNSTWDLWAYTSSDFDWDNLKPSYTPEEDTTISPSVLPNAGSKTIVTMLTVVVIISVVIYKRYNKFNDIK